MGILKMWGPLEQTTKLFRKVWNLPARQKLKHVKAFLRPAPIALTECGQRTYRIVHVHRSIHFAMHEVKAIGRNEPSSVAGLPRFRTGQTVALLHFHRHVECMRIKIKPEGNVDALLKLK